MSAEERGGSIGAAKVGLDAMIGFAGFALLAATMIGFFVIAPDLVSSKLGEPWRLRAVSAVCSSAGFLVICLFAFPIAKTKLRFLVLLSCFGFASVASVMFVPFLAAEVALGLWVIAGLGFGALATLWFCFVVSQPGRLTILVVSVGVAAGALGSLAEVFFVAEAISVVFVVFWGASLACALVLAFAYSRFERLPLVSSRESDRKSKILPSSTFMLAAINFEFGYVVSVSVDSLTWVVCFAAAIAAAVAVAVDSTRKRKISERSLSPFTPPLTTLAYSASFLYGDVAQLAALCALSMLFTVYSIFGISAMVEHVRMSGLSALRVFGKARAFDYLGIACGFACGHFALFLAQTDTIEAVRLSIAIAVCYCFAAAFLHKARFPEVGMEDAEKGSAAESNAKGMWKKRCRALGEECGLSDRQFEVLVLMSQGRNAKYIEQALTISLSTAQTHIRNIYRKTGVHSRQELLDLIENTKIYGEE